MIRWRRVGLIIAIAVAGWAALAAASPAIVAGRAGAVGNRLVIIATWPNAKSHVITFQDFVVNGEDFIAIWSDEQHFRAENKGSEFETKGVSIDTKFFVSLLKGSELLVLNPGSEHPVRLRKADLEGIGR